MIELKDPSHLAMSQPPEHCDAAHYSCASDDVDLNQPTAVPVMEGIGASDVMQQQVKPLLPH